MVTFSGKQSSPRRRTNGSKCKSKARSCSLSLCILYGIVGMSLFYFSAMVVFARFRFSTLTHQSSENSNSNNVNEPPALPTYGRMPRVITKDDSGDKGIPQFRQAWGHGVEPQILVKPPHDAADQVHQNNNKIPDRVLTAYLEPIDKTTWHNKPLPVRTTTANNLQSIHYPKMTSCSKLQENWPVDEYPDADPFLPWIHDVFPTDDGKFIQFVAQNKRRCRTGHMVQEEEIFKEMEPQAALFQHVAVKRITTTTKDSNTNTTTRYRLASHQDADPDGMVTRFICRFQPSGEETLSVYNANYEWASYRKKHKHMFTEPGPDIKYIHTTQLIFQCPVPESLQEIIRTGASVVNDYASLFVDVIPIRTPPRYGPPNAFFPPYYEEYQLQTPPDQIFDADIEWGNNHVLPRIEDSGRWENIPICKPTFQTYDEHGKGNGGDEHQQFVQPLDAAIVDDVPKPEKKHRLISCLWASTGYATRGNRFAINDGQRRLLEWISYNKLIGVDHFYVYDNSGAFSNSTSSLQPIADLFPDDVTLIRWPARVCNNNPNNVDSVGERSSQYAAESSCRLRFGPQTDWIIQMDIDEYLVPMGDHTSIHPLLDKLDEEGNKIISFGSWRAWPRRKFIEEPVKLHGPAACGRGLDCFELQVPMNYTMLQAYNCDRQEPGQKKSKMPAEKQMYRPDYVKQHFIHYSTITEMSEMNRQDIEKIGRVWNPKNAFPDPLSRFGDETNEGLMLHTKAVATQDTVDWEQACKAHFPGEVKCRLGNPFPENGNVADLSAGDEHGIAFNCYVNHKIEDYWVRRLEEALEDKIPALASRRSAEKVG